MSKDAINQILKTLNATRGPLSGADYPFVVLPALILKWMDLKNKEFPVQDYKEIYSPSRLFATYGIADKPADIVNYLLEFEEKYSEVYGGYMSEISIYLEKIPEQDFSNLLRIIAELDIKNSEYLLGIAAELMKSISISYGKMVDLFLSASCIKQIQKIAIGEVSDTDSIFDGFAGTGISTITATQAKGIITLVEMDTKKACIAEMICILSGVKAHIYVSNAYSFGDGDKLYNKVVMEPPFGIRTIEEEYRNLSYYDSDSDIMNLKYALSKIDKSGTAVVLCPSGVLFRGGKTEVGRKYLLEENFIDAVIQMPARSVLGTGISTAILVLKKNRDNNNILFVDTTSLVENQDKIKSDMIIREDNEDYLKHIIEDRIEVEDISKLVSIDEISRHECSLVITQYLDSKSIKTEKIEIAPLVEKNNALQKQLFTIEENLSSIRKRFLIK